MENSDLENRFTYHKPDDRAINQMQVLRQNAWELAVTINNFVPDGREKSLAITALEEVVMWANAGIARQF